MGKSLPIINSSMLPGSERPASVHDGRTVDDFKPYLVALNLTKRCNLKCDHCYLDATTKAAGAHDELTTEECFRVIDQIAEVNKGCLLVITGGEPLVRPDILDIARYAVKLGFMVVFGTNGMLINDHMAKTLVDIGVMGVGISIDSLDPATHNAFRGVPGAWESAVAGIEACKRNGLQFQIHFSVQPMNYRELPAAIDWAHQLGARVFNVFFMVCTGRGEELTDITPAQYEEVLGYLIDCQENYNGMLIRARCAPHFKRLAYEKDPNSPITKATGYMGGGCLAATNYARVTPNGELTPCPYMPLSAGNIRQNSFSDLWTNSEVFDSFRYPQLKGKCGDCEYSDICGGCRARPYVDHGDWLDEDQWCLYTPKGGEKIKVAFNTPEEAEVAWDEASALRLSRIPYFLRAMVKKGVEKHARENNISLITIALMEELRKKRFGNDAPVFNFDVRSQG